MLMVLGCSTAYVHAEKPSHLWLEETLDVLASQDKLPLRAEHVFRTGPSPDVLTYTIQRSSRETPLLLRVKEGGEREYSSAHLQGEVPPLIIPAAVDRI